MNDYCWGIFQMKRYIKQAVELQLLVIRNVAVLNKTPSSQRNAGMLTFLFMK